MRVKKYKSGYVSGAYKRECDRSGFDHRSNEMEKEKRTGLVVGSKYYVEQNNLDYYRVRVKERRVKII